ncbi:MAG: hypothetical protein M1814_003011 [Vezdaea aestivalis]|nr:MAG: hypothetical protein M1814_003011 [Vezdaea aestivalis]
MDRFIRVFFVVAAVASVVAIPSLAPGYAAQLVDNNLEEPRSIVFDSSGNLLVLQQNGGIVALELAGSGGIDVTVSRTSIVVDDQTLNHGLDLSPDSRTLYASSATEAYSWAYDPAARSVSAKRTLVTGMNNGGHTSRTLLISKSESSILLISHGSDGNIDPLALDITSGHSQIRAFNLSDVPDGGFDYPTQGRRVGWGLRNSVGVVEHPQTHGIFSVENSADQLQRNGVSVSRDNPGEELNYHGLINSTEDGGNFGYPTCFATWRPDDIPNKANLTVGAQFVPNTPNDTINDNFCARERLQPRLTFQAHMAPLDIKFNNSASEAWVSFHGSWNREQPVGYKVSVVPFRDGQPVAAPDNNTAIVDIMTNPDLSQCPESCFRPTGLAFDSSGRLFMTSDSTGELYVIARQAGAARSSGGSGANDASSLLPRLWSDPFSTVTIGLFISLVMQL